MPANIVREAVKPGDESVWDYPRPAIHEATGKHVEVIFNGVKIVDTHRAVRVLETSHPPVYYFPLEDVKFEYFTRTARTSYCEWKGSANYYTITVDGKSAPDAAWAYLNPIAEFRSIANYIAVYPALMDACFVDGEQARPQPGGYYGGWITHEIKGPFKGDPGTSGW
jgi:uncharacterized protein (DUF427 family)